MKVYEIISEMSSGSFATVAMPMTPGTNPADARKAVDPKGYGPNSKKAKKTKENKVYNKMIRRTP